jgi:hypothetical protein
VEVEYSFVDGYSTPGGEPAGRWRISLISLVLNNNGHGAEKAQQQHFFDQKYSGVDLANPRFDGSISKVEMASPMVLIYKKLFPFISTSETPPILAPWKTAWKSCASRSADGDPPPIFVEAPWVGRAYCWALRSAIQDDTWS